MHTRTRGFRDAETLDLGEHRLRFMETPHVHHWDSMMVMEETTGSLFPSDLYLQPGEQPAVTNENLAEDWASAGADVLPAERVRRTASQIDMLFA